VVAVAVQEAVLEAVQAEYDAQSEQLVAEDLLNHTLL
jgi:hypothetical protein